MSNQPPLNPDALEAGAKAMYNEEPWQKSTYSVESHSWEEIQEEDRQAFREEAEVAVSAYLTVAQPVVNSVEELDKLPVGTLVRLGESRFYKLAHEEYPWVRPHGSERFASAYLANYAVEVVSRPAVNDA